MSSTNQEFDVDLSFEAGIPDKVYGNFQKFKQIVSILLTVGYKEAKANLPATCDVKFLRIDNERNYIIGTDIGIPDHGTLDLQKLAKILSNTKLGPDFFIKYKEELQVYDLGIFV